MKKHLLLLLCGCMLYSCTDFEDESLSEYNNNNEEFSTRANPHEEYSYLGHGIDASGSMLYNEHVTRLVFDIERYIEENRGQYGYDPTNKREVITTYGYSWDKYLENIKTIQNDKSGLFPSDLTKTQSSMNKTDYSYALHEEYIRMRRLTLDLPYYMPNESFDQYLTPEFITAINAFTPYDFVDRYGTHVIMSMDLGAKLHFSYACKIYEWENKDYVKAGLSVNVEKLGYTSSYEYDVQKSGYCKDNEIYYTTIGGAANKGIHGQITSGNEFNGVNTSEWENSIEPSNYQIIGFPSGRDVLIPIYDFISNPSKRTAIKEVVDRKLEMKSTNGMKMHLYSIGHDNLYDFIYHGENYINRNYQGCAFYFPSPYAEENSGKLKAIYELRGEQNGGKKHIYYPERVDALLYIPDCPEILISALGGLGNMIKFTLPKIKFYVLKDQEPGTVPLYGIFLNKARKHVLTTSEAEKYWLVNNGDKNINMGIFGYVYPMENQTSYTTDIPMDQNSSTGGSVAIADFDKNGKDDFIFAYMSLSPQDSKIYYKICYDFNGDGQSYRNSNILQLNVPGEAIDRNSGMSIACTDLNNNGIPDVIFMYATNKRADGGRKICYYVAFDMNANGIPAFISPKYEIEPLGSLYDGLGIDVYDFNGNGTPDIIYGVCDAPANKPNNFRYKIGYDLNSSGQITGGHTSQTQIEGLGTIANGMGIKVADIDNNGVPDIMFMAVDAPYNAFNNFRYRILWNVNQYGISYYPHEVYKNIPENGIGMYSKGGDLLIYDFNGNGQKELMLLAIDGGENYTWRYIIGYDMNTRGRISYFK